MNKPVVLVSFFDAGIALGVRSLYATLRYHGIPAKLVHFGMTKSFPDLSGIRLLQCRYYMNAHYIEPLTEEEYEECVETIRRQNPLLVGLSVESRLVPFARDLTRHLGEKLPDVPVMWGGIHPTMDTDHSLQYVNTVCVGEGEDALVEVARRLRHGNRDFRDIPNLVGIAPDGARFEGTQCMIEDLDSLPLPLVDDRDNLYVPSDMPDRIARLKPAEGGDHYKAYCTLASRGCPFSCTYCYAQAARKKFKGTGVRFLRRRSPEHVVRELKIVLSQKQYHFISFWDDMFDNDIEWLSEFSHLYSREIGLPYGIAIHTHLVNERMVKVLKDSGCHSVGIGIQTGSARINRDIYRRPFRREKVLEAVSLLNTNFDTFYDLIVENPYETEAEILETIELFSQFPHPFKMSANTLLWFPGQEITRRALEDGKITERDILGHAPDAAHAYRDITHPKFEDDLASRRRHSLYLIAFAMQHPTVDRDQVLGWVHDDALLAQPYELQRRLGLMYLHESESDILDLQAVIAQQKAEIASIRQELDRKNRSLESSRAFI